MKLVNLCPGGDLLDPPPQFFVDSAKTAARKATVLAYLFVHLLHTHTLREILTPDHLREDQVTPPPKVCDRLKVTVIERTFRIFLDLPDSTELKTQIFQIFHNIGLGSGHFSNLPKSQ